MSGNKEPIIIHNINELEEGEISDSNINKPEIFKIIDEDNLKNIAKEVSFDNKNKISSSHEASIPNVDIFELGKLSEEDNDSDEEPQGYFHKMLPKTDITSNEEKGKFLGKKRLHSQGKNNKTVVFVEKTNHSPMNRSKNQQEYQKNKNKLVNLQRPKKICQFFMNGTCHKGNNCTYSHETPQYRKKNLCKYILTGHCTKGNDCIFSHNLKEYPCKFFHARGFCDNADSCRFSHARLSEEELGKFVQENEEFLFEIQKNYGKTNMDDYFFQYVKDKSQKIGSPMVDIPPNMSSHITKIHTRFQVPRMMSNINPGVPIGNPYLNPQFNPQMYMRNPMFTQFVRNPQFWKTVPQMNTRIITNFPQQEVASMKNISLGASQLQQDNEIKFNKSSNAELVNPVSPLENIFNNKINPLDAKLSILNNQQQNVMPNMPSISKKTEEVSNGRDQPPVQCERKEQSINRDMGNFLQIVKFIKSKNEGINPEQEKEEKSFSPPKDPRMKKKK